MLPKRYPNIAIRSKNELAKRISSDKFPFEKSLALINDVLKNFDLYWKDSKSSNCGKGKFVRSAFRTPLGKLLDLINKKVLAPYDVLLPNFIFGGLTGKNHVQATIYLLGNNRKRVKLGADIKRFFEQNSLERVITLLHRKCGCSLIASKLIAKLCCVPEGPKGSKLRNYTVARGFATSTRLVIWCNLDLFLRIYWGAKKTLKGFDPRISVFVDDIGITAHDTAPELMEAVYIKIENIFLNLDPNHSLPLNHNKKNLQFYKSGNMEHLGLRIGRKKVYVGGKTLGKWQKTKKKYKNISKNIPSDKKLVLEKLKSYDRYNGFIKNSNENILNNIKE